MKQTILSIAGLAFLLASTVSAQTGANLCGTPDLIVGTGNFNFDNTLATTGLEGQAEALCAVEWSNPIIRNDVWFTWVAPSSGVAVLTGCLFNTIDTKTAVYNGTTCPTGAALACQDDSCAFPYASNISWPVTSGNSYVIQLGNSSFTAPAGAGQFNLIVALPPSNDDCATPIVIAPGLTAINNSLASTGTQGQANGICLFSSTTAIARDLWYTYTATANGTATVTTCGLIAGGPSQDSKIAAYLGAGCPAAAAIACNDDFVCTGFSGLNSTLSFAVTCGTVYTVQIGMFGGNTSSMLGNFSLTEVGTSCNTVFTPYCTDSDGTFCPCNNQGGPGRGCENTASTGGGLLTSTGVADTSADTLVLSGSFLVPFGPGLYYQGSVPVTPGIAFGNGLRCAGGATPRIEIVVDNGLGGDVTAGDGITKTTVSVSAFGGVVAPATHYYQLWYRDTGNVGTCLPGAGFNFTNAISLPWVP